MTALLDAASRALAAGTGMTETQARGTVRLVLREQGKDIDASRTDYLRIVGDALRLALEKRRLPCDAALLRAVHDAVMRAPDADEDALDFFRDLD